MVDEITWHIEVFYVGGSTGWAAAEFDEDGNQLRPACFEFRKCDALIEARRISANCVPIHIFNRYGELTQIETDNQTRKA